MLNKVMVIGNLGQDPELRYTANGDAVATFSVAANETWTDRSGERRERVEWFSVVAWRNLAEVCAQYLEKGRRVYVEGKLQTRSWEGQDGIKRYKTEVVASQVLFLSNAREYDSGQEYEGDDDGAEYDDAPF